MSQSAHMDKSPLTQQPRPEAFQQKIVRLYEELFKVCPPPPISMRRLPLLQSKANVRWHVIAGSRTPLSTAKRATHQLICEGR